MRDRMIEDRHDKLRSIGLVTLGLFKSLDEQVTAHAMTRQQAIEQVRRVARAGRFDEGAGYIVAQTPDNMVIIHGGNAALEDKASGS